MADEAGSGSADRRAADVAAAIGILALAADIVQSDHPAAAAMIVYAIEEL